MHQETLWATLGRGPLGSKHRGPLHWLGAAVHPGQTPLLGEEGRVGVGVV